MHTLPKRNLRRVIAHLVLICAWAGSCAERSAELPDALFGEWRTREPSHAGRYLRIERDGALHLGLGEAGEQVSRIQHVDELEAAGAERSFALGYVDAEGLDSTLQLTFIAQRDVVIVGANRGVLWTRAEPAR